MFRHDPTKPLALSNSSASTFNTCERKGLFQYIMKKAPDSDYQRPDYFAFGSAYHYVLEKCFHNPKEFSMNLLHLAVKKEGLFWDCDAPKLMAIINSYWGLIENSEYKPYAVEKWFENDLARGKIDLILTTLRGWYICDTKTSGMALSPTKKMELINDPQMNLYGAFHDVIAKSVGLDPKKWLGVVYREVEKPRHQYRLCEDYESFYCRIIEKGLPKSRELVIPREELNWDNAYQNFCLTLKRARTIQAEYIEGAPTTTRQDFAQCKKYHSPCEYWSNCYGRNFTADKTEEQKNILNGL